MNNDERKSRLHIHLGGLIILIIIILVLLNVDIKSKIDSPQFQKNYTYIEEQVKNIWENYILSPIKSTVGNLFIDLTNKGIQQVQNNFTQNVLKIDPKTGLEIENNN